MKLIEHKINSTERSSKLSKIKYKEKILKTAREKKLVTHRGALTRPSVG